MAGLVLKTSVLGLPMMLPPGLECEAAISSQHSEVVSKIGIGFIHSLLSPRILRVCEVGMFTILVFRDSFSALGALSG